MTPIIITFLTTFALAALAGPIYIPLLKRLKFGQTVRDNGPQSHLQKMGTPTIGGLIFLTPLVIVCLFLYYRGMAPTILPLLFVTVGFGFVGFLDDFIKIVKKRKDGLYWYQKMVLLFLVALVYSFYIAENGGVGTVIFLDFFGKTTEFNMTWMFIPFSVLILLSSTNAWNLTDGLDGLCAGSSFIVFLFFSVLSMLLSKNDSVSYFSIAVAASVLGFLLFNYHPAKVFMGDTGSLALGGAAGACAIMLQRPLILLLAGLLFVLEALSVMIQVSYFKITHGKRFFKMAPIHHHFELMGWSELKVIYVFWFFTIVCCVTAYFCVAGW